MTITINDNLYNEIVKNGINLQKELSEMVSLYIQNITRIIHMRMIVIV